MKPVVDYKVHAVKGQINHIYVLNAADIVIVDQEFPSSVETVLRFVTDSLHRSIRDIKLICATHAHPDHIGGVDHIVSKTRASVALPLGSRPLVEGTESYSISLSELVKLKALLVTNWHWPTWSDLWRANIVGFPPLPNRFRSTVSFWLNDRVQLPHDPRWQVLETPGHTGDSICLYSSEEEALISGDLIINLSGQPVLNPIIMEDLDAARESLRMLQKLEVTHLYPGYGPPISETSVLDRVTE